jgi:type I restriction enzyme M protein
MLDTETKRRIDTARDILVGKVPDPKSQVEQITIALIYKFMDDMDAEVEELGGDRSFFAGEFAKFGWGLLMSPTVGGHELLSLYSEGISTMPQNAGIPALFRDIFKNAYLPYRDPETLKSFLKVIDGFTYDHSERLGDAFEYLLSVLGSQGDAGQFRTPRHIIDFIVEILRPQKGEVILDPACGTAGFLISAYKHILRSNLDAQGNSTLTPDEKGRMATNFRGYDISPDMVRLSLVNLYLHGFKSPQIAEYDTLTSEDKWNEFADVILANPPFMSPKGGIKRHHNRFTIKAKRSEVLFVDYMAEHLSPRGRAGIIVPEGIIFQSQTAYKDLRKMLVENSLVAVISLPAGVFNPYSGVKTSILILDKSLAKKTDKIAFFKVENDGFGLGAQRRAVEGDDLPFVLEEITNYELRIMNGEELITSADDRVLIVPKSKIAANGDYNLSGERYRDEAPKNLIFPLVKIGDICSTSSGGTPLSGNTAYYEGGKIPWLRSGEVAQGEVFHSELLITEEGLKNSSAKIFPINTVLVAMYGATAGEVGILRFESATNQAVCGIMPNDQLDPKFLYLCLKANKPSLIRLAGGGAQPNISQKIIRDFEIPLPPIAIQKEIVAEIEGYQKVINGARAVIDNYRPHIAIDPDWEIVELGNLCVIKSGATPDRSNDSFWDGDIPWVTTTLINYEVIHQANEFITLEGLKNSSTWIVPKGTVLMAMYGQGVTRGRVAILGIDAAINQACAAFQIKDNSLVPEYLFIILQSRYEDLRRISEARGGNQSNLSAQVLKEYSIPVPPIETQKAIVAEIEAEQALVNANRELIERFEKKIQTVLNRIWGGE